MASTVAAAATLACFLLCALSAAPRTEAAIECDKMKDNLKSCILYLRNQRTSPGAACCSTLKELGKAVKTQEDRKAACECFKEATPDKTPPLKPDRFSTLNNVCVTKLPTDVFINSSCEGVK